jgi:hypothetical protein
MVLSTSATRGPSGSTAAGLVQGGLEFKKGGGAVVVAHFQHGRGDMLAVIHAREAK